MAKMNNMQSERKKKERTFTKLKLKRPKTDKLAGTAAQGWPLHSLLPCHW